MDGKVTVSVRGILLTGLVLLAMLAAYLLGSGGGAVAPANAAAEQQATERRTISLNGRGEATAIPDQLTFALSVGLTRTDLDQALADANATMKRVLESLEAYGVGEKDVQTTGLSMRPVYEYRSNAPAALVGYRVSERAQVTVEDLSKAGKAITAAVNAGGNDVRASKIRLEVSDPAAVLQQARDAAVEVATTKAEKYAEATGQALGEVVSLREVTASTPVLPYAQELSARDLAYSATKAVPIRAGEDELAVTVQIVWEFS